MKRVSIKIILLTLILCYIFGLGANVLAQNTEPPIKPFDSTIGAASIGGGWWAMAEGMAEAVRRTIPNSRITISPGDLAGNPLAVQQGRFEYAITYGTNVLLAFKGEDPYDEKNPDLRAVMGLTPIPLHVIVLESSGIQSIEEIKEKQLPIRICVNTRGSASDLVSEVVLESYGITYEDIRSWGGKIIYLGSSDAVDQQIDGLIDMNMSMFTPPHPQVTRLALAKKIKMLSISEEAIDAVRKKYGLERYIIKAETYSFLKEDIVTFSDSTVVFTSIKIPEAQVYHFLRAMDENRAFLGQVHAGLKEWTCEDMLRVGKLPFHPGAELYYKKIGLMD